MTRRSTIVDGMKPCPMCGLPLPLAAFVSTKVYCEPCRRRYNLEYYRRVTSAKRKGERAAARAARPVAKTTEVVTTKKAPTAKLPAPKREAVDVDRLDAVERRPGRVPVLFGRKVGGVHLCYVSDGVEETGLFGTAGEAVGEWNELQVSCVKCQEMDRAHLEECARSGVLDSGDNCVARESITSVAGS